MRHTEFWARMEQALGRGYARSWADQQTIPDLGRRPDLNVLLLPVGSCGTRESGYAGALPARSANPYTSQRWQLRQ